MEPIATFSWNEITYDVVYRDTDWVAFAKGTDYITLAEGHGDSALAAIADARDILTWKVKLGIIENVDRNIQ